MPILESILEAEATADKLRIDANDKARLLLEEAKVKGEERQKDLYAKAKVTELQIREATDRLIQEKAAEIENENQQANEQIAQLAASRMKQAVDLLLKQVFGS
jgi:vacuolar-type H+-ATPase subunit H